MTGVGTRSAKGVVVWITGLPGAGKTVVGRALVDLVRGHGEAGVLLDGDAVREVFEGDLGYTRPDRLRAARRYGRLSRLLADQGLHVVVCTVSMFEEVWEWNRANLDPYLEVHLVASSDVRRSRDARGVYSGSDVPGQDVPVDEPSAHLCLANEGPLAPAELASRIWDRLPLVDSR